MKHLALCLVSIGWFTACAVATPDPKPATTKPTLAMPTGVSAACPPQGRVLVECFARMQIIGGMRALQTQMLACHRAYGGAARETVKLRVDTDSGKTTCVQGGSGTPLARCVRATVASSLRAPKRGRCTFTYPFRFDPGDGS